MRNIHGIVVTGGTGTVAYALITECIVQGINVLVLCHRNSTRRNEIPNSSLVKVIELNVDEYKDFPVTKELTNQQYDAFIHLAWMGTKENRRNDMDLQVQNIQGALDAVCLAKKIGCKIFMGSGSQAEYGRINGKLYSNTPTFPENGYGMAKLCAGQMTRTLCTAFGMDHIWTRILSTYGPGDWEHTVVSQAIKAFSSNKPIAFTKGEQIWDFIYCEDEAKILMRLLEQGNSGNTYCIGTNHAQTLRDSICDIYKVVTGKIPESYESIGIGKKPYSCEEVMDLETDVDELEKDIGNIEFTPFNAGIKKTVEWMKKNKMI